MAIGMKGRARGLKRVPEHSTIAPYLSDDLKLAIEEPILFRGPGSRRESPTTGHEATILVDLAEALLRARDDGALKTDEEKRYAEAADKLIRAFAQVGIIALIDEATGYQYDREKDELQKILKAYISDELLPWQKQFPDIYYKELFRLNGWDFTVRGIKQRPKIIGKWTNKLIYEQLPKGVLDELKAQTPISPSGNRTAKFHQSLTPDIGNKHLQHQISEVLTVFRLSDNMEQMWNQFAKLNRRKAGQLELDFTFDAKGHTVEPMELTDFDRKLQTALNFNPRDGE